MLELFMIYLLLSEFCPHGSKARLVSVILLWMTLNFEPSSLHILRIVVLGFCFVLFFYFGTEILFLFFTLGGGGYSDIM